MELQSHIHTLEWVVLRVSSKVSSRGGGPGGWIQSMWGNAKTTWPDDRIAFCAGFCWAILLAPSSCSPFQWTVPQFQIRLDPSFECLSPLWHRSRWSTTNFWSSRKWTHLWSTFASKAPQCLSPINGQRPDVPNHCRNDSNTDGFGNPLAVGSLHQFQCFFFRRGLGWPWFVVGCVIFTGAVNSKPTCRCCWFLFPPDLFDSAPLFAKFDQSVKLVSCCCKGSWIFEATLPKAVCHQKQESEQSDFGMAAAGMAMPKARGPRHLPTDVGLLPIWHVTLILYATRRSTYLLHTYFRRKQIKNISKR